jgi:uncharacterized Zn-finger protein
LSVLIEQKIIIRWQNFQFKFTIPTDQLVKLPTENPLDGSFLNISLEETVHTTKYDSYQCDICQKKFKSQHNLKSHLKIHDSTKFFCPSCT